MAVAGQCQLRAELRLIEFLFDFESKRVTREERRRRQPVQGCGRRDDDDVGTVFLVALLDAPERRQPLADQVLVRREGVVRQRFPVGEQGATQIGLEEGDFVD
jgi:hypothetical protein